MFEEYTKDLTIPEEWKNQSSINDECPSWHCNGWNIYIHHYDKSKADVDNYDFRFCVMVDDDDAYGEDKEFFCTNQFELVKRIVNK